VNEPRADPIGTARQASGGRSAEARGDPADEFEEVVCLDRLKSGPSPRFVREDQDHAVTLAEVADALPPILVRKETMEIIDGHHRVLAAKLRNAKSIRVRYFAGSDMEAVLRAIESNISHGKPLSLPEREAAAERILKMTPQFADRAIGKSTGLAPNTVAALRRRATEQSAQLPYRTGRDGRQRPVDPAEARRRIAEAISASPETSSRQVARSMGASPNTVRDVRVRLASGRPVETGRGGARSRPEKLWRDDSATSSSEAGRTFAAWFDAHVVKDDDWPVFVESVPIGRLYEVANQARARSLAWSAFAAAVELRARRSITDKEP
jgi:ParB-like chromosome segregation protein Spo0J